MFCCVGYGSIHPCRTMNTFVLTFKSIKKKSSLVWFSPERIKCTRTRTPYVTSDNQSSLLVTIS